jgi:chemotaxis protein CheZ
MSDNQQDDEIRPEMYVKLGHLTRTLHEALRELGYDKQIEASTASLPDARSRLEYIARLTGEAAEKVLNAVESASGEQARLAEQAVLVQKAARDNPVALIAEGRLDGFIDLVQGSAKRTGETLTDIMMAQDFHDLTGQVIARVVQLAADLEAQLVKLLVDAAPSHGSLQPTEGDGRGPSGPAMNAAQRTDVVQSQEQVDNLLESLGF